MRIPSTPDPWRYSSTYKYAQRAVFERRDELPNNGLLHPPPKHLRETVETIEYSINQRNFEFHLMHFIKEYRFRLTCTIEGYMRTAESDITPDAAKHVTRFKILMHPDICRLLTKKQILTVLNAAYARMNIHVRRTFEGEERVNQLQSLQQHYSVSVDHINQWGNTLD